VVQSLGFRFRVRSLAFRVWGLEYRVGVQDFRARKVGISAFSVSHTRRRQMLGWNQLLQCITFQLIFVGYTVSNLGAELALGRRLAR
jgi:hypothetical protein